MRVQGSGFRVKVGLGFTLPTHELVHGRGKALPFLHLLLCIFPIALICVCVCIHLYCPNMYVCMYIRTYIMYVNIYYVLIQSTHYFCHVKRCEIYTKQLFTSQVMPSKGPFVTPVKIIIFI